LRVSAPFIVSIPHRLGKEEARRRLQAGIGNAAKEFSSLLAINEEIWSGDRLTFRITALKQEASGIVDVAEDHVRLEVTLPWLIDRLARGAQAIIEKRGTLMLEKK
jgi:hypothetical protein